MIKGDILRAFFHVRGYVFACLVSIFEGAILCRSLKVLFVWLSAGLVVMRFCLLYSLLVYYFFSVVLIILVLHLCG